MPTVIQNVQKAPEKFTKQPENILHDVEQTIFKKPKQKKIILVLTAVLVIAAGTLTGYFLSKESQKTPITESGMPGAIKTGSEEGSADQKTFRDTTEGVLKKGGLNGEGTHHLIRGDESQTAYLTSSVIDLDKYIDIKIQVWGETFAAQKAGWFMDVGRIKVLDSKPQK